MSKDQVEFEEGFYTIFDLELSDKIWKTKAFGCSGNTCRVDEDGQLYYREVDQVSTQPIFLGTRAIDPEAVTNVQRGDWEETSYNGTINMISQTASNPIEISAIFENGNVVEIKRSI